MEHINYRDGQLCCEQVPVADMIRRVGTPAYVYSSAELLGRFHDVQRAFAPLDATICFSIKSLSNIHLLTLLKDAGSGFDVVSGGELARAEAIGADPQRIVFAGVGKTDAEISRALQAGIGVFNIESEAEFENLSRLAAETGQKARAALRVNPDVYDPKTHQYTATGKKESKFGVDIERAERFFATYGNDARVVLDGIHIHIGSPIYSPEPYEQAIRRTLGLIDRLTAAGHVVRLLDIGGGFACDYEAGTAPGIDDYARAIVPLLAGKGLEVAIEPGRTIAANAGVLLTTVLYMKAGPEKRFAIVDAAMTDLLRPALYEAEHLIYPARLPAGAAKPPMKLDYVPEGAVEVDVVGGVCESSDFLAKGRKLPPLSRGDLLAVFSAGAYGHVMSSQYNSRPRAPEVLVEGDQWRLIRRRESYDDLLTAERDV